MWEVANIDRTALPTALLPLVKAHCRVDFAQDDEILKTYTGVAIGQLEKVWGLQVFAMGGAWTPMGAPPIAPETDRWATPVMPVSAFTATDSDGADSTALFKLINKASTALPNYLATADASPFPAGHTITLTAGFAAAAEMPPEALGALLQVTARLYEYRENVASFTVNQMPFWLNDLLVGLWQPRA